MNQINPTHPSQLGAANATRSGRSERLSTPQIAPLPPSGGEQDQSSLALTAGASKVSSPSFDRARVDAIRSQLAAGQYVINARSIANGLLYQSGVLQSLD